MERHTPPEEMLLDYASGSLAEPLALLVASHLTLCPDSRREVRQLEELGGSFLETIEPDELGSDALDRVMARLDEAPALDEMAAPAKSPSGAAAAVPAPLRAYIGDGFDAVTWKQRGGSIAECRLMPDVPGYKTRLLRIRAGAKVPSHTHHGREVTLVLEGSFTDETGRYARGDVAVADSEVTHRPVAGTECDCICLAVTDAPLKMTGPVGRILNLFVDM